jgi:molybdopterin-containing oxidoreductase family iron-sulfur binding subunit
MTVAEQKQALVKIYNVISGSAIGTSKIANEEAVMKSCPTTQTSRKQWRFGLWNPR